MSDKVPTSETVQGFYFMPNQNDASSLANTTSSIPELPCPQCYQVFCNCASSSSTPNILGMQSLRGTQFTADNSYQFPMVTMQPNISITMPLYPPSMDQLLLPEVIQTSLVSMQYHQSSLTTYTSDFSGQLLLGDLMGPSYEQLLHPVQNVASVQVQNEITLQDFMSDIWPSAFEQTQGHQHDQVLLEQQGQVLLEQYNQVLSENHNQNVLERHKTGSKVMTTGKELKEKRPAARTQPMKNLGRTKITLKEKKEAIDFIQKNKSQLSWREMSEHLNINRTTLHRLHNSRDDIEKLVDQANSINPPFTMKTCRVIQSNFHTMEILLSKWFIDLQIQQIPTSEKWIQWQAFAVHRMLSGLSHEPLPPHKFSAGWLWSFKKRNQLKQVALNKKAAVNDVSLEILTLRSLLDEYTMDDIYFCDVTSIFALPECVKKHRGRACQLLSKSERTASSCERGPGVSLLLLFNASGTAKHEPVMLDRLFQTSPGLRRKSFANWLVAFNDKLERNVLLLVSIAIWEQIKDKLQGLMLTRVRVEAVPAQLNAWLPMRTGVAREFKAYINAINFEWTLGVNSIEGSVYKAAMQEIQASVIQQCFGRFKEAVQGQEPTEMSKTLTPAQLRLKRVLTNAHGKKPDGTADNSNKGVFEYYLNQDGDIGPNAFLCTEIQMMLSNSDTQGFLDASGYSTRPVREWWNFIVTNS